MCVGAAASWGVLEPVKANEVSVSGNAPNALSSQVRAERETGGFKS
jgi:hypothetical protein